MLVSDGQVDVSIGLNVCLNFGMKISLHVYS